MVYELVKSNDLNSKYLEISVWSYNIYELNTFLGQINIYLSETLIFDEQEHWFNLGNQSNEIRIEDIIKLPTIDKEKDVEQSERSQTKTNVKWPDKLNLKFK